MENRFIEFQITDDVFDEVMNEKIIGPGNELINEHNALEAKVEGLITVSTSSPPSPAAGDNWYKVIT